MTEQLCGQCKRYPDKGCFFREMAGNIANSVPSKEQQTSISNDFRVTLEAKEAHAEIEYYRNNAREIMACPNVNSVDPAYPGRNGL